MSKPKILLQLDSDPHPSVFDAIVAVDSGADHVLARHGVEVTQVRELVHGCMFTRSPSDLHCTAIFIGGSNVAAGEKLLRQVLGCFFGPMRVSVMLDANGANTTAAAAVLVARRHVRLSEATALVLAGTGPVGQRAAQLLAQEGATVRVASRHLGRAREACEAIAARLGDGKGDGQGDGAGERLQAVQTVGPGEVTAALAGVQVVIAAGAPGVELLSEEDRRQAKDLQVAIDLNAVPPAGLAGVEITDKAMERDLVVCYGALGVGGVKMKIHRAAVQQLFESNSHVLDAAEIYALGRELGL